MSALKVMQIKAKLETLFAGKINLFGIGDNDKQRETKLLTRYLAAYAVLLQSNCDEAIAGAAVWDGGGDNGIDAAFYDPNERSVLFVQSKWITAGSGEPDAASINSLAAGVKDIIEQDLSGFDGRLQKRLVEIGQAVMTPGVTIRIVVVSTGKSKLAKHATKNVDRLLNELNGTDDDIARFDVLGLEDVYIGLAEQQHQKKIQLQANMLDWSFVSSPFSAYFGIVDGLTLKMWWRDHGKRLVAKNIRYSLGFTDVNIQIRNTAVNYPERFWYFNNGITLIVEEVSKAPASVASRSAGIFDFKAHP